MRHLMTRPKLVKGANEDDNRNFVYRNFNKDLLQVMRKRDNLNEDLVEALRAVDITVAENDLVISIA